MKIMEFPRVMYTESGKPMYVETEKEGEKYFQFAPHKRVDTIPKPKKVNKKAVKKASK
jgi:hypothetical protein